MRAVNIPPVERRPISTMDVDREARIAELGEAAEAAYVAGRREDARLLAAVMAAEIHERSRAQVERMEAGMGLT